ncbi:hypothetical protein GCM10025771_41190 [Niveibacterium umoris]|uniref:Uncharacterized protein n=1 Tax=Niveibacterium umoris TaxID=1193620 RepID=A0A840BU93_9RHOO|nr:hypothetical protein [Niveibacterium umoris]MBB4014959.1 hypothetical protein [Niveibacterium umoris]
MHHNNPYWRQLEIDLTDVSGVIVPKGNDEAEYFESLRASIRENAKPAEVISAIVEEPGFLNRALGSTVTGYLLASSDGYWLVFEPNEKQYYCFWGSDRDKLGAFGVCGTPLYCWWE